MGELAAEAKADEAGGQGSEKKPLWWGLAIGSVVLSLAVGYRIARSDGAVDFQTGMNGIQVKIDQAQKTIESAQQEVVSAQTALEQREAELAKREAALKEREAQLAQLLASAEAQRQLTSSTREKLKELQTAAPPVPKVEKPSVKANIDNLSQLRGNLQKTSTELDAARAVPAAKL
jgi:chromosome segregation ATPase